jgi:membrane associated rhomboid family serine protease
VSRRPRQPPGPGGITPSGGPPHPVSIPWVSFETRSSRSTRLNGLLLVAATAALMWAVEIVDLVAGDLDAHGIRPRDADGLVGILTAPFLHDGALHLVGNTVPLLVLGGLIALGGLLRVAAVSAIVAAVSGLGVWLTAPAGTVHIGASGLVFGYAAYLIARGLFSRNLLHLAAAAAVVVVYGTTLLFGLVPTLGVSWQGHLFGALGGVIAARALHRGGARPGATRAAGSRRVVARR